MEKDVTPDRELDARGLCCPLPVLRTGTAMAALAPGQILKVISTDPGSKNDMAAWARWTGNELIRTQEGQGTFTFYIRKRNKE